MILEILVALVVLFLTLYFTLKKKKHTNIIFVGPRSTGKTKVINYLENVDCKTLPTLEPYNIQWKGKSISEHLYTPNYQFDLSYKYFFFVRDSQDVFSFKNNLIFVCYNKKNDKDKQIIYLDEDSSKIIKYL